MTTHSQNEKHHHVLPLKLYLAVGGALMVLTVITVAVSFVQFGAFNLVVAMLIASVKAILVALFFMHLLYDNKLFFAIFATSLAFVSVFIVLTMFDTMTRDQVNPVKAKPIQENARIYDKAAEGN